MKHWSFALLGLLFVLGVIACDTSEYPAATTAGFVNLEVSQIPSKIPASPTLTITPSPTRTKSPTKSPPPLHLLHPFPQHPISCLEKTGRIEERQLDSEVLDDPLEYLVYLPPCYFEQLDRHYPVLYLLHGQTYTNQHWIDLGAADLADRLISKWRIGSLHHGFSV